MSSASSRRDQRTEVQERPAMPTGRVKWYDESKGWGFIQVDDGSPEVFVHRAVLASAGLPTLQEGQAVVFETEITPKGPRAISIRFAGD